RLRRILPRGAGQPLGQRGLHGAAAEDHAGGHHARRVRRILGLLPAAGAELESCDRLRADRGRCVLRFSRPGLMHPKIKAPSRKGWAPAFQTEREFDQTASLSSLAARNATFLLALIWIGSPVAGLRPMRAARLRTTRTPRPAMRMRSPFFR